MISLLLRRIRRGRLQNRSSGKGKQEQEQEQTDDGQLLIREHVDVPNVSTHVHTPSITLPPELYRPIIELVESEKDLYNLLFVSQYSRLEAERVLYRSKNFQFPLYSYQSKSSYQSESSYQSRLSGFLKQISLCDRLALQVRDLTVVNFPSSTLNLLEQALHHMCNLKKLVLVTSTLLPLSFSGCCFQLHTLVMDGMVTNDSAFLETQKELTELDISNYYLSFSSDAFPKLAILSVSFPGSIYLINNRPLRALRLIKSKDLRIESHIRKQSVRSLRLPLSDNPEDFSVILKVFPSLRYLWIDSCDPVVLSANFVRSLFTTLSRLDSLEKLNLRSYNFSSEQNRIVAAELSFCILKNLQAFAFEYYTNVPPGRCIFVRMEWERGAKGYKRYPKNDNEWKDPRWC